MKQIIEMTEDEYTKLKYGRLPVSTMRKILLDGTPFDDIMTHLQKMADDEWNQQVGASKGLEDAIEVIESYTERSDKGCHTV